MNELEIQDINEAGEEPKRSDKTALVWMVISGILLVLLIVVAVANPFAKKGDGLSDAVAKVNGVKITKAQLYEEMYENGGSSLLQNLIVKELIRQETAKLNITVTEADIDAEIERHAKTNDLTAEELEQMFSIYYGISGKAFRDEMAQQLKLRLILADHINVTDEQVRQYYDEHLDEYKDPEQVRASHIIVDTEEEALEIIAQLKNGADFAELAKERSGDGAAAIGGDLGYFTYDEMTESFSEVVFAMEVGTFTEVPVKTEFGYHVILNTDHQAESTIPFEDVKEKIAYMLEDQALTEVLADWFAELEQNSDIEYLDEQA